MDVQKDSIVDTDRGKYPASRNRLLAFGTKLNKLLDTVASMEGHIQKQEDSDLLSIQLAQFPQVTEINSRCKLATFKEHKSYKIVEKEL